LKAVRATTEPATAVIHRLLNEYFIIKKKNKNNTEKFFNKESARLGIFFFESRIQSISIVVTKLTF
jgi:hypothetical protein